MPVLGRRNAVEQASRDCLQRVQGVCRHLIGIVSEGSCCASLGQFGVPCVPSFGLQVPVEDGGSGTRSRARDCYSQSSDHDSTELGFRYMQVSRACRLQVDRGARRSKHCYQVKYTPRRFTVHPKG